MKKVKKSIKGMTLIEVVVSLLIISTASLIMVQGFTTANRMLYEANQYNETTNDVRASLIANDKNQIGKDNNYTAKNVNVKNEMATTIVTLYKNDDSKKVELKGSTYLAESKIFSDSKLRVFSKNISLTPSAPEEPSESVASGLYESYCQMMEEIGEYLKTNLPDTYYNATSCLGQSNAVKKAIPGYLRSKGITDEQMNKCGLSTNSINLIDKIGEVYIARFYPDLGVFPSITENTAKKLSQYNNKIYADSSNYPGNKNNYCFPTIISTLSVWDQLTTVFEGNYYKDHIFIILYNHANVQTPDEVYAVYDNKSTEVDNWFVYDSNANKDEIKTEDFKKNYSTFTDFYNKRDVTKWKEVQAVE